MTSDEVDSGENPRNEEKNWKGWEDSALKRKIDHIYSMVDEAVAHEIQLLAYECEMEFYGRQFLENYQRVAQGHLEQQGVWACVECEQLIPLDLETHAPCDGEVEQEA